MLDSFAEYSVLIQEIESIADMDLRDIKCLLSDDAVIETIDKDGNYIWDTVGKHTSLSLKEVRAMLDNDYTAIPF